jgi:hypothetical protein
MLLLSAAGGAAGITAWCARRRLPLLLLLLLGRQHLWHWHALPLPFLLLLLYWVLLRKLFHRQHRTDSNQT